MIINHNMNAMNAHRMMTGNTASAGKSMEKLSSGLRINRAGDDAAGLAISEKMRGQIRGLDQAGRNSQDAISLIQTAEGALNETHSILQRMRELAVQASNDTNVVVDRGEIQKEMSQLTQEIDRIGNTTEFNTRKLLDGSQNQQVANTHATIAKTEVAVGMNTGDYTVTTATVSKVAANFNATAALGTADSDITFGANANIGDKFKLVVNTVDATHSDVSLFDGNNNLISSVSNQLITGAISVGGANGVTIAANKLAANESGTIEFDFGMKADYTVLNGATTVEAITNKVTTTGKVSVGGFDLTVDNALTAASGTATVSGEALQLQIGANENQSMRVSIRDMRSENLGVDSLTVDTHANAKASITTIQSAIETVSAERSKLGAYQNRLEHTINNLGTSSENLQSAESRIRDVDMAKEMMTFSKNNILSQAAQAMISQANQQPQGVLQLLR